MFQTMETMETEVPIVPQMKLGLNTTVKITLNMVVAMGSTKNGSKHIAKLLAAVVNQILRHQFSFYLEMISLILSICSLKFMFLIN